MKPTLHIPGLFHTYNDGSKPSSRHSSCAFTGKCRRFPKMMHTLHDPWRVVEYSNVTALSESDADEKVEMLTQEEFDRYYPLQPKGSFHAEYARIGERGYPLFDQRLKEALKARVKPRDIILHSFGRSHPDLVHMFPQCSHIEPHIGYVDHPFGAFRVFETQAWRHYHMGRDEAAYGKDNGLNKLYQAVVPNFYDLADWPVGTGAGDYFLYMGRIEECKGMATIVEMIRVHHEEDRPGVFVFAGQGNFKGLIADQLKSLSEHWVSRHVEYRGVVSGSARIALVGDARCMLMPTTFVEPFGGSGAEAMLCGTPLIAQGYGAFTETVKHGVSGYRCNTLGDWLEAVQRARSLDRNDVWLWARDQWSLEACAPRFDAFFKQVNDLWEKGWYTREARNI